MSIIDSRVVTTRKPHRCPGYALTWPAGTEMFRVKHTDMGAMCNDYWCPPCESLIDGWIQDGEYEGWDGDIRRDDQGRWLAACEAEGVTPPVQAVLDAVAREEER